MAKSQIKIPAYLLDADQILVWKASLALMDGRGVWPRAMKRAIEMIEARDPLLKQQYLDVKGVYVRASRRSKTRR
jgi:hypothetical protein